MKILFAIFCSFLIYCSSTKEHPIDLKAARLNFKTNLIDNIEEKTKPDIPDNEEFLLIKYPSEVGELSAYITPRPKDNKRNPAIIWVTGGDCNSIGNVWHEAPYDNDQTACAYKKHTMVMMFPSLRGGNDNQSIREGFLGEVNDIISAFNYLKTLDYVDTTKIYLGGHSTGGTLVLLVDELFSGFTGVFSFGPVGDISRYGEDTGWLPFDLKNKQEVKVRSPGYWLDDITTPTWVIEGEFGNISELMWMQNKTKNSKITFISLKDATHFTALAPTNEFIANKIFSLNQKDSLSLVPFEVNAFYSSSVVKKSLEN